VWRGREAPGGTEEGWSGVEGVVAFGVEEVEGAVAGGQQMEGLQEGLGDFGLLVGVHEGEIYKGKKGLMGLMGLMGLKGIMGMWGWLILLLLLCGRL